MHQGMYNHRYMYYGGGRKKSYEERNGAPRFSTLADDLNLETHEAAEANELDTVLICNKLLAQ